MSKKRRKIKNITLNSIHLFERFNRNVNNITKKSTHSILFKNRENKYTVKLLTYFNAF